MVRSLYEEICDVLDKYGKSYTENGVLANLNMWSANKRSLANLLRKHPNWDEDAQAVILETTEERKLVQTEVQDYAYSLKFLASELRNTGGIDLDASLAFSRVIDTLTDYPSKCITRESLCTFLGYDGVKAAVNQKTSRVINAAAKKYGIDKHARYNEVFAKLADSLNPISIKKKALLSVHPCDFLEMSRGYSWKSCHRLNGGEYQAGTLSYMNDGVSMIFYTVADEDKPPYYAVGKRTRQVFCYGNGILLQSRLYPDSYDEEKHEQYRNIVQKIIADCKETPNLWTLHKDHDRVVSMVKTHVNALHYEDYMHKEHNVSVSLLKSYGETDKDIVVGNTAYCLYCADKLHKNDSLICEYCGDEECCTCCGCSEVEFHYIDDYPYCDDCCHWCCECGEYTTEELIVVNGRNGEIDVCEQCVTNNYTRCYSCLEHFRNFDVCEVYEHSYCRDCAEELFVVCSNCGEYVQPGYIKEINGYSVCEDCYDEEIERQELNALVYA